MNHPSHIELSRSAYERNLRFLRRQVGPQTRVASVIKGNAYGHGIDVFVPLAEACGVRQFCVFSADEAYEAFRSRTAHSEILIMGEVSGDALEWAISEDIAFYVFDLPRLAEARECARRVGRPARIHLELETGLNRLGLEGEEVDAAIAELRSASDVLRIEGVCTHFAGAESVANEVRVMEQFARYRELCRYLEAQGLPLGTRHTACSAAALSYPDTTLDMVRIGIAQYGYWPSPETRIRYVLERNRRQANAHRHPEEAGGQLPDHLRGKDPLRRVMRWVSRVMSLKTVLPGEFIGYGTSFLVRQRMRIAAVPVGYYHGFSRALSNLGYVLCCGRRAPVVGLVNMSMIIVDVTGIPDVTRGCEVVLIGRQGRMNISVSSFGELSRNVNYEVLVRIPPSLPRRVVA